MCLRRRPLLTFNSICLVRGAACACVVSANVCVCVRMCVCVCCLPVCMQSIANVEEKQQLQNTFIHTNIQTQSTSVVCLWKVCAKLAKCWQTDNGHVMWASVPMSLLLRYHCQRGREPSFVWSALRESAHMKRAHRAAHEESAERASTMCALRVGERFTVMLCMCLRLALHQYWIRLVVKVSASFVLSTSQTPLITVGSRDPNTKIYLEYTYHLGVYL